MENKRQEIALRDKRHLLVDMAHPVPDGLSDYASALAATGVVVLDFEEFGSYQGDWWSEVKFPNGEVYYVNGSYGSCSGCDSFEAEFGWDDGDKPDYLHRLKEFGLDYLTDCMTLDQAIDQAGRNLSWDMDAQEMVNWLTAKKGKFIEDEE